MPMKVQLSVRIEAEEREKFQNFCYVNGISMQDMLVLLIQLVNQREMTLEELYNRLASCDDLEPPKTVHPELGWMVEIDHIKQRLDQLEAPNNKNILEMIQKIVKEEIQKLKPELFHYMWCLDTKQSQKSNDEGDTATDLKQITVKAPIASYEYQEKEKLTHE